MAEMKEFYVTYRADEDGPTSTCIASATDEGALLAWFAARGRYVASVTPRESAPSWMGEGKAYRTVECVAPADGAEDDARERIVALEKRGERQRRRIERLVGECEDLAGIAERAERALARSEKALARAHEDAVQAVVAALLWGECGIDVAADARLACDVREGNPIGDSMTLYVGARQDVTLSVGAAELLRDANAVKGERGVGVAGRHDTWRFDLRKEA